jgi:hypothetical protein
LLSTNAAPRWCFSLVSTKKHSSRILKIFTLYQLCIFSATTTMHQKHCISAIHSTV